MFYAESGMISTTDFIGFTLLGHLILRMLCNLLEFLKNISSFQLVVVVVMHNAIFQCSVAFKLVCFSVGSDLYDWMCWSFVVYISLMLCFACCVFYNI